MVIVCICHSIGSCMPYHVGHVSIVVVMVTNARGCEQAKEGKGRRKTYCGLVGAHRGAREDVIWGERWSNSTKMGRSKSKHMWHKMTGEHAGKGRKGDVDDSD
jgi:hypothetical protein